MDELLSSKTTETSVMLETAFCGKAQPKLSPQEKISAQAKDRLIQRLCNETDREFMERKNGGVKEKVGSTKKKAERPTPVAARRKKNQFCNENQKIGPSSSGNFGQKDHEEAKETGNLNLNWKVGEKAEPNGEDANVTVEEEYDVPWEFCSRKKLNRLLQNPPELPAKPLNSALNRKNLTLNFGCAGLNPVAENVDTTIPLSEQLWYHGNICRSESEMRLAMVKEGSYLIRNCESNREEYALSVKSAKGFMHMKIQRNNSNKWILGYFSQPFDCIPSMVKYYSINKLPIKGAEHMCLLYPLNDTLL